MMFHLVTVFPINAAEHEKYYITNVLKKPQCVNVQQFVRHVEQLNTYIAQMLCFYNSPTFNATTKPENVPFMEAELESHVLRMCLLQWQGQYNLHKKGMTPIDLHLLLTSLEAIEHACTQDKAKMESSAKASHKGKMGRSNLVPNLWPESPRKSPLRSIATCARSMGGVHTPCTIPRTVVGMRKKERRKPISVPPREPERNPILQDRTLRS
jgi:hypothetical protein